MELPPLISCARHFFFWCYLLILQCTSFLGLYWPGTHEASMGSCLLVFLVGQLCSDQISFGPLPIQKSTIKSTLMVPPAMPELVCAWQTCDGLSRMFHIVHLTKTVFRHDMMCRHMHRWIHISKVKGRVSFCHAAKFWYLNGSWFLIFRQLCLSGAGTSSLA